MGSDDDVSITKGWLVSSADGEWCKALLVLNGSMSADTGEESGVKARGFCWGSGVGLVAEKLSVDAATTGKSAVGKVESSFVIVKRRSLRAFAVGLAAGADGGAGPAAMFVRLRPNVRLGSDPLPPCAFAWSL